jgi:hypothetical protein
MVRKIIIKEGKTMSYRMFSLSALAMAFFVANSSAFAAEQAENPTHDGTVVSLTEGKLVMKTKDGKEHTHSLSENAKVTLDGKSADAKDLTAGIKIRVSTLPGNVKVATQIEAISKNENFANTHVGELVSMSEESFMMTTKDGKEHSHTLAKNAEVTRDGKPSKMGDLKAGMRIRVTTKASDAGVAIHVEALDKNANFS